jgi:glycerol-3-phosphate cytidylyltransferase-like family protein
MIRKNKKIFVSGVYEMLHSGHIAFFKEASMPSRLPLDEN